MTIRIVHLYPDLLDLYGDRGNVLVLAARCKWRGLACEVVPVALNEDWRLCATDILFIGGGSDREQGILVADLTKRAQELKAAIEDGLVVLAICGGYQMLGQYYETADGKRYPGLQLLDFYTKGGERRLVGNVLAQCKQELIEACLAYRGSNEALMLDTLVGFENHGGRTYLGSGLQPVASVVRGAGNNGEDGCEGLYYQNVIATYLHGPFLPKNPHIADLLLWKALARKGRESRLEPLDDSAERSAHQAFWERFSK